jgi:deazaflavin-dependent oxidoreductase (nitroreductase family)
VSGVYARVVNRFSATRLGSWTVKHVAAKVDPRIFRATGGRFTVTGRPTLPMLALTTTGRKTGQPRTVQLAYHRDGDDLLVVASAMGQDHHPAWRHNLESEPRAEVLVRGESFPVVATLLDDDEKARVWPAVKQTIPQMTTYEARTTRQIGVFRLVRASRGG